jgi:hypothetical protein
LLLAGCVGGSPSPADGAVDLAATDGGTDLPAADGGVDLQLDPCAQEICRGMVPCYPPTDPNFHGACSTVGLRCDWGGEVDWTCECDHTWWQTYGHNCMPFSSCPMPDGGFACADM